MNHIIAETEAEVSEDRFDVKLSPPTEQLLAWRGRMGNVLDLLPTVEQARNPFRAWANRYVVGDFSYSDLYSDPIKVERSLARISTSSNTDYFLFCVSTKGNLHQMEGRFAKSQPFIKTRLLALDLDQPVRMQGFRHRFSSILVPRRFMESIFPNADALHGRELDDTTSLAKNLITSACMLNRQIKAMSLAEANSRLKDFIVLAGAAFGKQARLAGNTRAALRNLMFGKVRDYIKANLEDPSLSAQSVLRTLNLPRHTLYRLFEHEGGIAAYICDCRLRAAASDLKKYPHIAIKDIGYGVGFNSASAFSRAFRHSYELSPQDLRALLADRRQE